MPKPYEPMVVRYRLGDEGLDTSTLENWVVWYSLGDAGLDIIHSRISVWRSRAEPRPWPPDAKPRPKGPLMFFGALGLFLALGLQIAQNKSYLHTFGPKVCFC